MIVRGGVVVIIMETNSKRVAIVGAGVSGLAACKHLLERGFNSPVPVVFESGAVVGGVWARVPDSTALQTPRPMYQYSDFPWPDAVTDVFPGHRQVMAYLDAYARRFGVMDCVRFRRRVLGMEYHGVDEDDVARWEEWSGNGEAFGSGAGEWHLKVADAEGRVEVQRVIMRTTFLLLYPLINTQLHLYKINF